MKRLIDPFTGDNMLQRLVDYEASYIRNFLLNYMRIDGLPVEVDDRFFKDSLIVKGFCGLIYHSDKIGFLACDGSREGVDRYYRPINFQGICTALPNIRERKIYYRTDANLFKGDKKRSACICYNTLDVRCPETMQRLIFTTAHLLAEIDLSMLTSTKNSRVCLLPVVNDQEEALRTNNTLMDIYAGKPASIVFRSGFKKDLNIVPIKARDNIVTSELADARRNVLSDFLRRVGVNTIAVDKRERTNTMEMESNRQELNVNSNIYMASREIFCQECNEAFGLNIKFVIDDEIVNNFLNDVLPADVEMAIGDETAQEADKEGDGNEVSV